MTYVGKYSGSVDVYMSDLPTSGTYDCQAMALSLEHPTFGDRPLPLLPQPVPYANDFIRSSEFCGSCHDLTVPLNNHGMPEQRTYTEWKFSSFGQGDATTNPDFARCQDCHMPTLMHEYTDDVPVSLNPDPTLAGWFPYAKDRNPNGGTAFHKFAGANLGLPDMMTVLYPEVDMEVVQSTSLTNTALNVAKSYGYRVQAYNNDGVSAFSNVLSATTR